MGPPRKVDANDDRRMCSNTWRILFGFILIFFYRHDVGSKLEGHTFDPSEVDS